MSPIFTFRDIFNNNFARSKNKKRKQIARFTPVFCRANAACSEIYNCRCSPMIDSSEKIDDTEVELFINRRDFEGNGKKAPNIPYICVIV